jgi:hypothetical protein
MYGSRVETSRRLYALRGDWIHNLYSPDQVHRGLVFHLPRARGSDPHPHGFGARERLQRVRAVAEPPS